MTFSPNQFKSRSRALADLGLLDTLATQRLGFIAHRGQALLHIAAKPYCTCRWALLHTDVPIRIDHQRVALHLHRMNLKPL
jgi:hypothetical protein